jgi:hypothetical protein
MFTKESDVTGVAVSPGPQRHREVKGDDVAGLSVASRSSG